MFSIIFFIFSLLITFSLAQELFPNLDDDNGPGSNNDLKTDLQNFISPVFQAMGSAKPIVELAQGIANWLDSNLIGQNFQIANSVFQANSRQLEDLKSGIRSQEGIRCINQTKGLLLALFQLSGSDSSCFMEEKQKFKTIATGLLEAFFPTQPTAQCPLPILCDMDFSSFSFTMIQQGTKILNSVRTYGVDFVKFFVYFKDRLNNCNRNLNRYADMGAMVVAVSKVCANL